MLSGVMSFAECHDTARHGRARREAVEQAENHAFRRSDLHAGYDRASAVGESPSRTDEDSTAPA